MQAINFKFLRTLGVCSSIVFTGFLVFTGCSAGGYRWEQSLAPRVREANRVRVARALAAEEHLESSVSGVGGAKAWKFRAPDSELPQLRIDLGSGVWMEFVYVGPGEFTMGSPDSESGHQPSEAPAHTVKIGHGFWMARTEVTQAQWEAVMGAGSNPSRFTGDSGGALRPVERVSWIDANSFCRGLSQALGASFRLPSEAEWEYACRAGTSTPWWFGDDGARLDRFAWFDATSADITFPVGLKGVNPWGLTDLYGNVREWCQDAWHPNYNGAPGDGSAWVSEDPKAPRVLRGGDFDRSPTECRSASRTSAPWDTRFPLFGFRPCVDLGSEIGTPAVVRARADHASHEASKAKVRDAFWKAHATPPDRRLVIDLGKGQTMEFLWVEPGSFQMGSPESETFHERNEHPVPVTIRRGFWMARTEVTQAQFAAIMGAHRNRWSDPSGRKPADSVSWPEAREFCERVATKAAPMRLPSEAEWEYACRAGTSTAFSFGDDTRRIGEFSWSGLDSGETTAPVGTHAPNPWGFHDMHGNVWEWCQDTWHASYQGQPADGSAWIRGGTPWLRVMRGGSWDDDPSVVRSANRNAMAPTVSYDVNGFRPVIDAP